MEKTTIIRQVILKCKNCQEEIYQCDDCGEYLDDTIFSLIFCETTGKHYCMECGENKDGLTNS